MSEASSRPGLIGVLLATPFLLELKNGTYRLAWTQSITRGRWIAVKLALATGAAVLGALALVVLMTWWRAPLVHIDGRIDQSGLRLRGHRRARLHLLRARPRPGRRHGVASRGTGARRRLRRLLRLAALRRHQALSRILIITQWPSDRLGNH